MFLLARDATKYAIKDATKDTTKHILYANVKRRNKQETVIKRAEMKSTFCEP